MNNNPQTKHLMIFGRVQGVGYRMWAKHMAQQCRMAGWVRNRADGKSVELLAQGHEHDMERFIKACYDGPKMANVEAITITDSADDELDGFELKDTV